MRIRITTTCTPLICKNINPNVPIKSSWSFHRSSQMRNSQCPCIREKFQFKSYVTVVTKSRPISRLWFCWVWRCWSCQDCCSSDARLSAWWKKNQCTDRRSCKGGGAIISRSGSMFRLHFTSVSNPKPSPTLRLDAQLRF